MDETANPRPPLCAVCGREWCHPIHDWAYGSVYDDTHVYDPASEPPVSMPPREEPQVRMVPAAVSATARESANQVGTQEAAEATMAQKTACSSADSPALLAAARHGAGDTEAETREIDVARACIAIADSVEHTERSPETKEVALRIGNAIRALLGDAASAAHPDTTEPSNG